ncbi:MAG: hypothetical protein QNJ46_12860 [Leptolyngbyaceae cyanobacterium MO_188.B28]|nr:hypothetical protein [Leptolyngbyaceae cyanobacterium MO_188.B28]
MTQSPRPDPAPSPSNRPPRPTNQIEVGIKDNSGQAIAQMENSRATSIGDGAYIENAYFSGNVPLSAAAVDRETPSLLPYLADRSDQEYALGKFIRTLQGEIPPGPLVILIHGDEFQCHLKFMERLKTLSLPRILAKYYSADPDEIVIQEHQLDWPSGLKELSDLSERLQVDLAETVLDDPYASLGEINQAFYRFPGIKMISTTLLTSEWKDCRVNVLEKLLEFWQQWPPLMPDQKLIVCISVKYQLMRSRPSGKFGLSWLFNFWKCWKAWRRRKHCQQINAEIGKGIDAIAASNFERFDRLFGIVLPKLTGVRRSHVEDWVRSEAKEFLGEANLAILMGAVRDMYDALDEQSSENEATLSMEELSNQLIKFLKSDFDEAGKAA